MTAKTALLVEDNEANAELATVLLQRGGYDVHRVATRHDALDAATEGKFTVILMDLQLPDGDGLETVRELRQNGCPTPIVALTANAMAGDRERALAAGCDGYIPKPIDTHTFIHDIESALGRDG